MDVLVFQTPTDTREPSPGLWVKITSVRLGHQIAGGIVNITLIILFGTAKDAELSLKDVKELEALGSRKSFHTPSPVM